MGIVQNGKNWYIIKKNLFKFKNIVNTSSLNAQING